LTDFILNAVLFSGWGYGPLH